MAAARQIVSSDTARYDRQGHSSMSGHAGTADIPLDAPIARHPDVVPAREDRTYLLFIGSAMLLTLFGGLVLAVLVSLAASGAFLSDRLPWLIQAHGWAQLEGWAGLFVAGMGIRILPRFAGMRPLHREWPVTVFVLLFLGVVVRVACQPMTGGVAALGLLAGEVLWAAGAALFAITLGALLLQGRGRGQAWHAFALAGSGWWAVWSIASVVAGIDGFRNDGFVTLRLDDALAWTVMLGAVGNFTWAVQGRSVPIFFGRKQPGLRRIALPATLLNAGTALILAAAWNGSTVAIRVSGAGLVLAGLGLVLIAPVAGSCWGKAGRLRPRARSAARFVLVANNAAVAAGLLLAWAGVATLVDGSFAAPAARDAARHAIGLGLITMLIVGMAQLIAPFFALKRIESAAAALTDDAVFWLLTTSLFLRVTSALLLDVIPMDVRMHIAATAGTLAWLGLALFAVSAIRAIRSEPRLQEAIATAAGVHDRTV